MPREEESRKLVPMSTYAVSEIDVRRVRRSPSEVEEPLGVIGGSLLTDMDESPLDIRSVYAVRYAIVVIVETSALISIHVLEAGCGTAVETRS